VKYTITLNGRAKRDLKGLTTAIAERIIAVLQEMEDNPLCVDHKKLKGSEAHRIRVGDHRIIYGVDHNSRTIRVVGIKDRKDAY
jgi:mRNA interferase RelE/StbE